MASGSLAYWLPLAQARFARFATDPRLNLEDLQAEFQALAAVARLSRQYWNFLIPISRLPDEILRHVFDILEHQCHESYVTSISCKVDITSQVLRWADRASWISVAHVCQRWRQVALSSSHLWSNVCFGTPSAPSDNLFSEILARSNNCMLDVALLSKGRRGLSESLSVAPQLRCLMKHTNRLRSLTFDHFSALQFLSPPSPSFTTLENLSFINPDFLVSSFGELSFSDLDIGHCTPQLKHLRVHGIQITGIPNRALDSLTSFHFSATVNHGNSYTWNQSMALLDVLTKMPRLEDLHITNAFPSIPRDNQTRPIELPASTKSITLEALDDDCALRCMDFSQMLLHNTAHRHTTIVLPVYEVRRSEGFLRGYFGSSCAPSSVFLECDLLKSRIRTSSRTAPRSPSDEQDQYDFVLDLTIKCYDRQRDSRGLAEALQLICRCICTTDLTHIKLWGTADTTADAQLLDSTLKTLGDRQVKNLTCIGALASASLAHVLEEEGIEGVVEMFPKLERLHLAKCAYESDSTYDVAKLLAWIQARHVQGASLHEVRLPAGSVDKRTLERLGEVANKVVAPIAPL